MLENRPKQPKGKRYKRLLRSVIKGLVARRDTDGGVALSRIKMDRSDIEEMAKDLIPLAEEKNAGEALMITDYDDKWEFVMGFRKKKKYRV